MKNIYDKILDKDAEFAREYGDSATSVYLGKDEMRELLKFFSENSFGENVIFKTVDRPEVAGLQCFEVNAESHLEVS